MYYSCSSVYIHKHKSFKVIKAGFVSIRLRDAKLHYIRKSIYLIRKRPRIVELGHIAEDIELILLSQSKPLVPRSSIVRHLCREISPIRIKYINNRLIVFRRFPVVRLYFAPNEEITT